MIRIEDIHFRYDEDRPWALDGVSLAIQPGEFVAVLGANGCGKSTLAKHLNAILIPQQGTVWVEAMDTKDDDHLWDIRQKVGMVFQNPDNQIVATIVEEDVAFALENLGVPPDEMRRRIDEAMEATGIAKYRDRQPHKLSGGQKQRVAIAGVLAMNPDCIVLDEATAMLDPYGRARIMRTVRQLNETRGITVVHITHYMEEAAQAGRVVVMDAGGIAFQGTPKEVFSRVEELRRLHLDIPQSAELCELLTQSGLPLPRGVTTTGECVQLLADKLKNVAPPLTPPTNKGVEDKDSNETEAPEPANAAEAGAAGTSERTCLSRRAAHVSGEIPADSASADSTAPGKTIPADVEPTATEPHPANKVKNIIEVQNLTYTYNPGLPDATTAIHDLSFTVPEHCFLGIIGPTGCGKSTLITHFNGLMKPTSGRVLIDGADPWENHKNIRRFRFLAGLVFQYPEYQLFEETVEKDIAFGPRNMGLSEEEIAERVAEAARFCGIRPELMSRSPFELSGGQKRRAAIAGVLAMRPKLLVLDEPASGLDPKGRDTILGMLKAYHKETGTSVVLVSHSMEDIAKYADRVLVMKEGGIAMYDDMHTVFARADELVGLGLAVPQITTIFLGLRQAGIPIGTDVYTVKYGAESILKYTGASPAPGKSAAVDAATPPPESEAPDAP